MVFSSNEFLFVYLPLSLIFYYISPKRWRNAVLFVLSLIFYGWERTESVFIMLFCIVFNYFMGHLIERGGDGKRGRRALVLAVVLDLLLLGFFKYADLLLSFLGGLFPQIGIEPLGIRLPIGISFYVFQSLSYVFDVYRGQVAQRSLVDFGAYVSMFPQLIAGPIVRYSEIEGELRERFVALSDLRHGAERFIIGLAKKVLLADASGGIWERIIEIPSGEGSVLLSYLGVIFYAFQIYFDFSGYSDMAIGLGLLLGFHFPENFKYPYTAKSISDFWRRWHVTLSSWFREYLYVPLGGSRAGVGRTVLNLLAVWSLTGLWHGASWNFLLWGLYYFLLLIIEKFVIGDKLLFVPLLLRRAMVGVLVLFGWLIFYFKESEGGFCALWERLLLMLGFSDAPLICGHFVWIFFTSLPLLCVLCVGSTPLPKRVWLALRGRLASEGAAAVFDLALDCLLVLIFVISIAYISSSEYRPNIYFEF